jgi:hypothetical protein
MVDHRAACDGDNGRARGLFGVESGSGCPDDPIALPSICCKITRESAKDQFSA